MTAIASAGRHELRPSPCAAGTVLDVRTEVVEGTEDGVGALFGFSRRPVRKPIASHLRFHCEQTAVLRATPHAGLNVPSWPDLQDRSPAGVERCRAWLREAWSISVLAEAVRHASPDLADDLDRLVAGASLPVRQVQRLVLRLGGYVLRLQSRATPFGLFAGVAPARFSRRSAARWGTSHRATARAGGRWLADVVAQLQAIDAVRGRLPVMVNSAIVERSGRIVVPWRPRSLDSTPLTGTAIEERSVPATPLVRAALDLSASPLPYYSLVDAIVAGHPVTPDAAGHLLDQLIEERVLLTSLHAPNTELDALGLILAELQECGAATESSAKVLVDELHGIHHLMSEHGRTTVQDSGRLRRMLIARMTTLSPVKDPLALDVLLDADVQLPHAVAREIEAAAAVLARVSRQPLGAAVWSTYYQRFIARYGRHKLVPLTDLLEPDVGLGLPQGYLGAGPEPSLEPTARDRRLLAMAQMAAATRRDEVALDEMLIRELSAGDPDAMLPPAHVEIAAQVQAVSQQALNDGDFRLVVTTVSRAWGTLSGGRLAGLMDGTADADVPATLARLPLFDATAIAAQLSFPSLSPSGAHIARTPQVLPTVVSVGEHRAPGPDVITPDDLAVGADGERLFILSLSRGRRVEPTVLNPLQPWFHTPTLARFLSEIARGRAAVMDGGFDWALAADMPFLPRIRFRRTVLSPARWRLDALPGRDAPMPRWEAALGELRGTLRIPPKVLLTDWDKRLLLDLDSPAHRALLRSHVERSVDGSVTLTEGGPDDALGWTAGRPHEVVALLRADATAQDRPAARTATVRHRGGQFSLPGASDWLSVLLPASRRSQRDVIAEHLPQLLTATGTKRWWFSCGDHQLYLHLQHPGQHSLPTVMRSIATWAQDLSAQRIARGEDMALIAYRPDESRWGARPALRAAEDVFACDSRVIAHQLRHQVPVDRRVSAAATLVAMATDFTGSHSTAIHWLVDHPLPPAHEPLPQAGRKDVIHLADPAGRFQILRSQAVTAELAGAWAARRTALTAYGHQLREGAGPDPDQVLNDLLSDHLDRITRRDAEEALLVRRLARAAALAHHARTGRPNQ